jgi:septation ring formation regulator EzrA
MEREQQAGNTLDAVDGRMNRLEQEVAQLRNEIAKLHQSNAIAQAAQAEMRKVLVTIQGNQAELQRALIAMENGIGNTLAALGPTLLAAINQQIDQHAQAAIAAAKAKEERLRTLVPPAPPRTRL